LNIAVKQFEGYDGSNVPALPVSQAEHIWQTVLNDLRREMDISPISWQTWFAQTRGVAVMESRLMVEVPQEYVRTNLRERWLPTLEALLGRVSHSLTIDFILENERARFAPRQTETGLNDQYDLAGFVVGNASRLAYAAAKVVAEHPAKYYNPLFIYGGTGLGKTHLMQAIGREALARNPGLRVLYVSSERFTNDLVMAIKNNTTPALREKYRQVDLLLVDDIQLLAGRESTQSEFYHTFDELFGAGKQIVICSDRPPREIPRLEDKLRSRFENGLVADIGQPDTMTRVEILNARAAAENVNADIDALEYMADMARSNVRELEGAFTRVCAFARLTGRRVDRALAREALASLAPVRQSIKLDPNHIIKTVCDRRCVAEAQVRGPQRSSAVSLARTLCMYFLREMTDLSLAAVGDLLGGREHSTVAHSVARLERLLVENGAMRQEVADIRAEILK